VITEYLRNFFKEMEAATGTSYSRPHAIAYHEGSLFVLINMGDVWARVFLEELDPDPVVAARILITRWKSMTHSEKEAVIME
jgi:hypothetical protein